MIQDCYLDPDDAAQVAELARLEALRLGFEPEAAAREAAARWGAAERRHQQRHRREVGPSGLAWLPESRRLTGLALTRRARPTTKAGRHAEARRRKRAYRDTLALVGAIAGFSHRQLAEALDMTPSRVGVVIAEMAEKAGVVVPGSKG